MSPRTQLWRHIALLALIAGLAACVSAPRHQARWPSGHRLQPAPKRPVVIRRPHITPIPSSVLMSCVDLGHGLIRDRPPSGSEYRREIRRIRVLYRECASSKQTSDDWLLRIAGEARYGQ